MSYPRCKIEANAILIYAQNFTVFLIQREDKNARGHTKS